MDIPLFEESLTYARVLDSSLRSRFHSSISKKREVNWAKKYNAKFYEEQKREFIKDPLKYISAQDLSLGEVESMVYEKVSNKLLLKMIFKILAHWFFRFLGFFQKRNSKLACFSVYRRCYVDDAELVFDDPSDSVLRAIYPFPLGLKRQVKYVQFLRRERLPYFFSGTPYLLKDFIVFLRNPKFFNLMRLEKRAQILHAIELAKHKNIKKVECSEEYDVGSLDYSHALKWLGIHVLNSAHGVGKYLPYHAYSEFFVLTENQKEYYNFFNPMEYGYRKLNNKGKKLDNEAKPLTSHKGIVFLGQYSEGVSELIKEVEFEVFNIIDSIDCSNKSFSTYYKPHPNSNVSSHFKSNNLRYIAGQDELEGLENILYVTMFSTCQIDPNFEGDKILVGSKFIRPEISFSGQDIIELEDLRSYFDSWIKEE